MIIKMKIIILFLYLIIKIYSFEFSRSKNNILLNQIDIKNTLFNIVEDEDKNRIKILNNPNQKFCKDCFEIYCLNNNINYEFVSYDNFINNSYKNKNIIFIEDFMINYGRTLMNKEKEIILNYNSKSKIIFNTNDYDNLVLKDDVFIKKFKMYNFPKICKINLNNYIFNLIEYYNYNSDLKLINWKNFDIDKLNFKEIEDLIFNLHMIIISNNYSINYIEEIIKKKLLYLDKKYYD